MNRTTVTLSLDELIDLDVFPMNTVFANRGFDTGREAGPDNPPFYRLVQVANDRAEGEEVLAAGADMNLNEYRGAEEIDIKEEGVMGELTAHVNPKIAHVTSIDDPEQVQFVGLGRRAYDKVQKRVDQGMLGDQLGTTESGE